MVPVSHSPMTPPTYAAAALASFEGCIDKCIDIPPEKTVERWMCVNICSEEALLKKYMIEDRLIQEFHTAGKRFKKGKTPLDDAAKIYDYGRVEQLLETGIFDVRFATYAFIYVTSAVEPENTNLHKRFNKKKTIDVLRGFIEESK